MSLAKTQLNGAAVFVVILYGGFIFTVVEAQKAATCCASFSSFYSDKIVPCPDAACGLQRNNYCVKSDSPDLGGKNKSLVPLVKCTKHMCPTQVHWHVKENEKEHWRVKITIINFNYNINYTHWNLVVQHPNFDHVTQVISLNHKPILKFGPINDTSMLWGVEFYNAIQHGHPLGFRQLEVVFEKDEKMISFDEGWAFPQRIDSNGEKCVLPPAYEYHHLPKDSVHSLPLYDQVIAVCLVLSIVLVFLIIYNAYYVCIL